jgi:hypothetical protein
VYTAKSWTYQEERKNRMNAQSVNPVSVRRNSPAGLVLANGSPTGSAATSGRTESQKILAAWLGCTHTTQCLLLDNTRTEFYLLLSTFKELQRANAKCAHAHLSTIYACCQDGMTGTSPMGRSDGTRGQKPAYSYREATLVNLTKIGI